jgi:hypothetical protein
VTTRRNLTPSTAVPLPQRRDGARREVSERVIIDVLDKSGAPAKTLEGWALNLSRGGVRAIVDEPMELGQDVWVAVGPLRKRPGKIVWIQEEPDGAIIGVAFNEDGLGSSPSIQLTPEQLEQAKRAVAQGNAPPSIPAPGRSNDDDEK